MITVDIAKLSRSTNPSQLVYRMFCQFLLGIYDISVNYITGAIFTFESLSKVVGKGYEDRLGP